MGGHRQRRRSGITEDVATGIGGLHKAADGLLGPLKPVDDVIHGVARGAFNWLTDTHPEHDSSSDSDCDGPPPPRRKPNSSCSYGRGYPNSKRDVFTGNRESHFGTVKSGGSVRDSAKFTVN